MSLATVYCTDEDLLVRAPADYLNLCPKSQVLAQATDGVFAAGARWTLTSAATDFVAAGVAAGHVVALTAPRSAFPNPGGLLLVVDAVATGSIVLRRPGMTAGVGLPPGPAAGLTGVSFTVPYYAPQIDQASYDVNAAVGVDPADADRAPSRLYDVRELRRLTVLTVLKRLYVAAEKTAAGDYALRLADVSPELGELRSGLVVHWGEARDSEPPDSVFASRLRR